MWWWGGGIPRNIPLGQTPPFKEQNLSPKVFHQRICGRLTRPHSGPTLPYAGCEQVNVYSPLPPFQSTPDATPFPPPHPPPPPAPPVSGNTTPGQNLMFTVSCPRPAEDQTRETLCQNWDLSTTLTAAMSWVSFLSSLDRNPRLVHSLVLLEAGLSPEWYWLGTEIPEGGRKEETHTPSTAFRHLP